MTDQKLIEQYKIMHRTGNYGTSSITFFKIIFPILKNLRPKSILDYGCGQSVLLDELKPYIAARYYKYDPAIDEYRELPSGRADLVVCTDVLEHIPEDDLRDTFEIIKSKSENVIFSICTRKAVFSLPNGDNCHCTVKPREWWIIKLKESFSYIDVFWAKDYCDQFLCSTFRINQRTKIICYLLNLTDSRIFRKICAKCPFLTRSLKKIIYSKLI